MKLVVCLLAFAISIISGPELFATPINYREQVFASGLLGSTAFSNALVTISAYGDTGGMSGAGGLYTNFVSADLTIAGVGATSFTDAVYVFDNQGAIAAGVADSTRGGSILDTFDASFGTYDLTTSIGPITGTSYIRPDLSFNTQAGLFTIGSAGDSTFTAEFTATPEPTTLALFGLGVAGLRFYWRRRKRAVL